MKTASVSVLKNQLSAHLKEVLAGETYLVTDRNHGVAMLSPLCEDGLEVGLERQIAEGLLRPRAKVLDLALFMSLPKASSAASLSTAIHEEREKQ